MPRDDSTHVVNRAVTCVAFVLVLGALALLASCATSPSEPSASPTGSVAVDPEPDSVRAPWSLGGPGGYSLSDSGDTLLQEMPVGDYVVTWQDVGGYVTPAATTGTLGEGETLLLTCTYVESSVVEMPQLLMVPSGTFTMGYPDLACADEHEVTLTRAFWLGENEVTNQQYVDAVQWAYDRGYVTVTRGSVIDNLDGSTRELMDLRAGNDISFSEGEFSCLAPENPAYCVTWYGAARYCDWLSLMSSFTRAYEHSDDWSCNNHDPYGAQGFRLPTDAEWEYAARYNDGRRYPWGDEVPTCDLANYMRDCAGATTPVGSYPAGHSALGFADMAGNVWEWCNDWVVCDLGTAAVVDPTGPEAGGWRVRRGGSRGFSPDPGEPDLSAYLCQSPYRGSHCPATHAATDQGFRVARTLYD